MYFRAFAPQQEKPPQGEAHAPQLEKSPHSPQLEKNTNSNEDLRPQKSTNFKKKKLGKRVTKRRHYHPYGVSFPRKLRSA